MDTRVDIVLPCYNPPAGWQQQIRSFYVYISEFYDVHLFVVNDGSDSENIKDTNREISDRLPLRLIPLKKNYGKGYALRAGIKHAAAPYVLYTDIDLPFTKESIKKVLDEITSRDCDIAAGTRDTNYYNGTMSRFRSRLSRAFRLFMKKVVKVGIDDTQCGLKAFNAKGRHLFLATHTDRYLFDFEFIYSAYRTPGMRVKPVSVQLRDNVVFSNMKWPVLLREAGNLVAILLRR